MIITVPSAETIPTNDAHNKRLDGLRKQSRSRAKLQIYIHNLSTVSLDHAGVQAIIKARMIETYPVPNSNSIVQLKD